MSTGAKSGFGTTLTIAATAVTEITEITPPGGSRTPIDATNMGSPSGAAEYIMGVIKGGECTVKLNFIKSVASTLIGHLADTAPAACVVTLPSSLGTISFSAWVSNYKPGPVGVDDKVSADLTLTVTGLVTLA